jgi:DNA-binding XRE family transcriptional regulator
MKTTSTIKDLRLLLGKSQAAFGEMLNVSRTAIAYYEARERFPKKNIAYKIIDIARSNGLSINLEDIYPRQRLDDSAQLLSNY